MFKFLSAFSLILTLNCEAQFSKLNIQFIAPDRDSTRYMIYILKNSDTICKELFVIDYNSFDFTRDSIYPDQYKLKICKYFKPDEFSYAEIIELYPDSVTNLSIDISSYASYHKLDSSTRGRIVNSRGEGHISLSYLNGSWIEPTYLKSCYTLGWSSYYWHTFSKHLGFSEGIGLGYNQYNFKHDTSFVNTPQFNTINEKYNYLDAHFDLKFRISSGNQQLNNMPTGWIIDIGLTYYVPVIFKHVIKFEDNKKLTNSRLHQFRDLRAFINLGYSHFSVFYEYRLSDFVLGNYPELPKYNAGIRFFIFTDLNEY